MGCAWKIERYEREEDDAPLKRFLDVYHHRDGSKIFHLRNRCDKRLSPWKWEGVKLSWFDDSEACWVENGEGARRDRLPQKRNRQEAKEKPKLLDWRRWALAWDKGDFELVAVVRK